ncbi:MAG: hypothetical protein PHR53_03835 [Bacteroidales bacterium]|nr:hypothetical protein [Bacteroidales bacterium]
MLPQKNGKRQHLNLSTTNYTQNIVTLQQQFKLRMTDSIHIDNYGNSVCFSTVTHELSHHWLQDTTTQPPALFYEVDFKKLQPFQRTFQTKTRYFSDSLSTTNHSSSNKK